MNIVEGSISVKAVLNSRYRKVNCVYIAYGKDNSDVAYIIQQAKKQHIEVKKVSESEIASMAIGKSHGGVLADVTERKIQAISSLLLKDKPFLAFVEGVEDGFNFGYILRTLYAFGCDGVVLKDHYFDFAEPTIIKSSAGASELIPIVYSNDLQLTFDVFKSNNIKIISAFRGGNPTSIYKYDFTNKGLCICIGGPLRGLSKIVLDNSDDFVYIPYGSEFRNALNASSATAVIAGEIFRQNSIGE